MEVKCYCKCKTKHTLLLLLCLMSLSFLSHHTLLSNSFSSLYSHTTSNPNHQTPICSSPPNNTICCDLSSNFRSDTCHFRGDIAAISSSSTLLLRTSAVEKPPITIHPYPRKWEHSIMSTIPPIHLLTTFENHTCDVKHNVPAIFFSIGGYTGNVYHDFNDILIPLYITSKKFESEVVFVVMEYKRWWAQKYGDVLSRMSHYDLIDFNGDNRTHCFPEVLVGLQIHGDLEVDSGRVEGEGSVYDFRNLLDKAYRPRIWSIEREEKVIGSELRKVGRRPRVVIVSRNGSRRIENQRELVGLCEKVGFDVQVLTPDRTTELAKIYRALNNSDVMIGAHGAAMTHLLFMRPGSVIIQIVPLGTNWAAETYYGEPARKMSLKYVEYKIETKESSLNYKYDKNDPILQNPRSVTKKGWQFTKEIYLDGQNVTLDLERFKKCLLDAYKYIRRNDMFNWNWGLMGT